MLNMLNWQLAILSVLGGKYLVSLKENRKTLPTHCPLMYSPHPRGLYCEPLVVQSTLIQSCSVVDLDKLSTTAKHTAFYYKHYITNIQNILIANEHGRKFHSNYYIQNCNLKKVS